MRLSSVATPEFWELYRGLPAVVRTLARKNYQLWQNSTFHPAVRFKRLGGGNWSARVGDHYRAVGKFSGAIFRLAMDRENLAPEVLKGVHLIQVLAHLDAELARCERALAKKLPQMEAEEQAAQAAGHLPSAENLDKILRYETTLWRQLYRSMNQLERLQRRRLGEEVPPPLNMEVSHRL